MGFLFAASIFAMLHFGILTGAAQWILLWLGLQRMRACHSCFDKARLWLLGAIAADCLALIFGYAGESSSSLLLLSAVRVALWLYTWYLIYHAILALESVYGDLHGHALIRLWRGTVCVWLYGCCMPALGMLGADLLPAGIVLYWAGNILLGMLRAVWLYRAWRDYTVRAQQLASAYTISPEEEKDT